MGKGKDRTNSDSRSPAEVEEELLRRVDPRIASLFKKIVPKEKLGLIMEAAEHLIFEGKQEERALADALELFKLV